MQKIYSLLRNNIQTGPYSLEELLQLSLKPFDLVWVEGKSGGWSYPSEIDSLKTYVSETPKREEKQEPTIPPVSLSPVSPTPGLEMEIETNKITSITAAPSHIYIRLPAGSQKDITSTPAPAVFSEIVEESPEAKLERKALELRNKIQAFAANKNKPKDDNEPDIKYSRSLEDIKEEYSSWLHKQQKTKGALSKKPALIAMGAIVLLIAGYFIAPLFSNKNNPANSILSAEEIRASAPAFEKTNQDLALEEKKFDRGSVVKLRKKNNSSKTKTGPPEPFSNQTMQVDGYIDSLKAANKTNQQAREDGDEEAAIIQNDGSRQSSKRDAPVATTGKPTVANESESLPFTELVKLSESIGSGSSHLSLYNNSNKHINFVAVDVSYYKANKKLLQKKTLYFKDIAPKSSAKLFIPQEAKAASVEYQMGLISTDNGLYYAKQ